MIQTKIVIEYGDRSEKSGIIKIEVRPIEVGLDGTKYLVNDWDITKDSKDPIHCKEVFWTADQINQMDEYLESIYDFSALSRTEKEWKKMQMALLIDTQTNIFSSGKTIYRQPIDNWEYSPS
jgi:hypothetical protein